MTRIAVYRNRDRESQKEIEELRRCLDLDKSDADQNEQYAKVQEKLLEVQDENMLKFEIVEY